MAKHINIGFFPSALQFFSPSRNQLCMIKVTRRCLRALDMWRKPWFLSQVPVLGAPCRRITLATDESLTGWGAVISGHPAHGLWIGRLSRGTSLPGDTGRVLSTQTLSTRPERSPCAGAPRQHSGGLLYQPPGGLRPHPLYKLVH